LLIVIFATGWVVTAGTAKEKARERADEAVVDRLTEICIAQFNQDPEKDAKLRALKEESSWQRGDFVVRQGWATMPGSETPNSEVGNECAERIIAFAK
jgi:hypothetical protein